MTIENKTPIAKLDNGVYVWDKYGSNTSYIQEVGHHAPTLAELNAAGWLLKTAAAYDPAKHKPVVGSFSDDGSLVTQNTIALTVEEAAENVVAAFNAKVKSMTSAVQTHLDETAQSWGYDNIISLCTYDGNSDLKYSAEGAAGKEWRSSVWRYCEDELVKIAAGTRQEPESNEAFIAELPIVVRPKL